LLLLKVRKEKSIDVVVIRVPRQRGQEYRSCQGRTGPEDRSHVTKFMIVLAHLHHHFHFQNLVAPPFRLRINYKMAKTRKTTRKTCRQPDSSISMSPSSPRKSKTIVDTPRRVKLIRDAQATADKLPRKQLFRIYNIAKATGYQILKLKSTR
jgi:hypothetical protein